MGFYGSEDKRNVYHLGSVSIDLNLAVLRFTREVAAHSSYIFVNTLPSKQQSYLKDNKYYCLYEKQILFAKRFCNKINMKRTMSLHGVITVHIIIN